MANSSDLARQRLGNSLGARQQQQAERLQQYEQQEQPALYAGGNRIRPLGAAGAIVPRGINTSGALAIGAPVSQSQGLVGGMPSGEADFGEALKLLKQELGAVALARGAQVGTLDPNETELLGRYPQDLYWYSSASTLFYWQPGTETDPGEWIPFLGGKDELNGYIEAPAVKAYPLIYSARSRTRVVQLLYSGSGSTAALSAANDTVLEVGDSLSLNVTVAGSDPISFTVELEPA